MMKKGWFSNLFKADADTEVSAKSPKSAKGGRKKTKPKAAEAKPTAAEAKAKAKGGNGSTPIDVGGQMTRERREAFDKFMRDRNKILEDLPDETRRRIEAAVRRQTGKPNGG